MMKKSRIAVALSGGVDSSVAAWLLHQAGEKLVGVYMKNWSTSALTPACTAEQDRKDALRVAAKIGIPFEVWDFEAEYRKRVLEIFFAEYQAGRTPNPDILCNREIKFGLFLEKARRKGFSAIATGHYAKVIRDQRGVFRLYAAKDKTKDQSYFLTELKQPALRHSIFPLSDLLKTDVRAIARQAGLPTAEKKDSQGICFIGPIDLVNFLKTRLPEKPGEIVDEAGTVVGRHQGLAFATIGQRHGLDIGGAGIPYYVVGKDTAHNRLLVAQGNRNQKLFREQALVETPSWTVSEPTLPVDCQVRVRYRQPMQRATLLRHRARGVSVLFKVPQRAVTPGQYAVFYQGEELIGGGAMS